MAQVLQILGRISLGLPFLMFGLFHFLFGDKMVGGVPAWIPGGIFWVYFTGVALLGSGIYFIGRFKWTDIVMNLNALMLLIFIVTIHVPMIMNEQTMHEALIGTLKDLVLLGASLYFGAVYSKEKSRS